LLVTITFLQEKLLLFHNKSKQIFRYNKRI